MNALQNFLDELSPVLTTTIVVIAIVMLTIVSNRILRAILRRAYWRRLDRVAAIAGEAQFVRIQRQRTLVTLLESLLRYAVYGAALVVIINVIHPGASSTIFSLTLLGVLIGFGFQRLLGDVVAGALMLFEGQYAVGDTITLPSHDVTGIVEEFTLRATTLRTLSADRITVLNGAITSVIRWSFGMHERRIEFILRDNGARELLDELCGFEAARTASVWVAPPQVSATEPAFSGSSELALRVHVTAGLSPEHDTAIDHFIAQARSILGEAMLAEPLVVSLRQDRFDAWRDSLLIRG